jgi:very-short-patch-repair endonuclease
MRIAAAQDGAVSAAQLAAAGLTRRAVEHRLATGLLTRVHRGVYLLGPLRGPHFAERAALLACGRCAVLSHRSALALWGLADAPALVEVTRPSTGHAHEGVRVHRCERMDGRDTARRYGLPVTAPARTLLDVASSMPAGELARLVEEAQVQRLTTRALLLDAVERGRYRPGAPALRAILEGEEEPALTRSEAERRLLALIRAARLAPPRTNVRIGRHEVDLVWPEQRLVVEVDGFAFHGSRTAFERDRRRDAELLAMGYRVVRFTWRQLTREPEAVIVTLASALSAARPA